MKNDSNFDFDLSFAFLAIHAPAFVAAVLHWLLASLYIRVCCMKPQYGLMVDGCWRLKQVRLWSGPIHCLLKAPPPNILSTRTNCSFMRFSGRSMRLWSYSRLEERTEMQSRFCNLVCSEAFDDLHLPWRSSSKLAVVPIGYL